LSAHGVKLPAGLERELAAIRARGFAHGSNGRESGLAFPIRKLDQAFASVAIEGSGYVAAAKAAPVPEWQEIARAIEAVVRANPALGNQPFQHIDPDVIVLPS
jgi:DNA-binding IclR family transcriptional regulator